MSVAKKFAWGCLAVVLLLFGSAYMGWRWVATNLAPTLEAENIAEMQQLLIDIDIPSDFTPTFAMYTDENKQDALLIYIQEDKRTVLSQLILHQQLTPFSKEEADLSHVYSAFFEYRGRHMSIMLAGDPQFLNRGQFEQLLKSIK